MMANHHNFCFQSLRPALPLHMVSPGCQNEADDHNTPGPFSYLGYMQALLKEGFWGDELCLALISMMWQISITVLKGETFHQIKFRHSEILKDTDLVLVHCQG